MPRYPATSKILLACVAAATALPVVQAQDWAMNPNKGPSARKWSRLVYDSMRQQAVLFGGLQDGLVNADDTWLYKDGKWSQAMPAAKPSARMRHAMCYDSVRGRVVLFGGAGGISGLRDTWQWDGTNWTETKTTVQPGNRDWPAMAFDSDRKQCVLFGGSAIFSSFADTWTFDGTAWTRLTPVKSPPARSEHEMVYDSRRKRVVLFGGSSRGVGVRNDTWEFDGVTWVEVSTASRPSPRSNPQMTYDSLRGRVVLHGGSPTGTVKGTALTDTWEYDGENWYQYRLETPPGAARFAAAMAFDSKNAKHVRFGGGGFSVHVDDTYELGGEVAAIQTFGKACVGSVASFALTPNERPKLGAFLDLTAKPTPANAPIVWLLGLGGTSLLPVGSCAVLAGPRVVLNTMASGTEARLRLAIPQQRGLRGLELPVQALAIDAASSRGYALSNAVRALLF